MTVTSDLRADVDLSPEALAAVTAEIALTAPDYDRSGAVPWAGLGYSST